MKDVVRYAKISEIMRREWERINREMIQVELDHDYESLVPLLMARDMLNGVWIALGSEVEVCVGSVHGEQDQATDEMGPTNPSIPTASDSGYIVRDGGGS